MPQSFLRRPLQLPVQSVESTSKLQLAKSSMKAQLTKPLRFRWANQHHKDFKLGDPEVTFTLPIGTEVELVATRAINTGRTFNYFMLKVCDITYTNPLSGGTSGAIVTADHLE